MEITINRVNLNVVEAGREHLGGSGARPSLVLLHYFGGSSGAWAEVSVRLASRYHCLAPDLRGFGESAAPAGGCTLNDYADDVAALIEAASVNSYVLVGHSMGGKIALALAARRPASLRALVLLAPSPPTPEPIPDEERARLLDTHGDRRAAEETVRHITHRPLAAPVFARCVADNLRASLPAWRAWLEAGSREDISEAMARIDVPTLVVAGAADAPLTAPLLEREVVGRLADARLTTLPDAAHLLPLEAPAAVAGLIDAHCRSIGAPV